MQKVQAYLKMIISTLRFQFPHANKKTPYYREGCQTDADGSDEINCPDNHLHDVIQI